MSTVAAAVSLDREQAILSHLPQVKLLAIRMHRRCPPEVLLDDLVSAGTLGLIQAVDRHQAGRNAKLQTFAEHRIQGAMLDYLRQLDPLPRSVRKFQRNRDASQVRLEARLNRTPSEPELAAELGLSVEKYRRLTLIVRAASTVSLDSPTVDHPRPLQVAGTDVHDSDINDRRDRLRATIADLPSRERAVMAAFQCGLTVGEVARKLRVSESYVSQLKGRAILRLRTAFSLAADGSVRQTPSTDR